MSLGFIIGNGTSREGFDLEQLRGKGTIVGCNWLYKEFTPDIIVAVDNAPKLELFKMGDLPFDWISRDDKREWMLFNGARYCLLDDVNGNLCNNSGIIGASYLAKVEKVDKLIMIGIDFFRLHPDGRDNDIYSGRIKGNWIHHAWNKLVADCPDTTFYRVGKIYEWDLPYYETILQGIKYKEFYNEADFI